MRSWTVDTPSASRLWDVGEQGECDRGREQWKGCYVDFESGRSDRPQKAEQWKEARQVDETLNLKRVSCSYFHSNSFADLVFFLYYSNRL
jgi:hypothetical protein